MTEQKLPNVEFLLVSDRGDDLAASDVLARREGLAVLCAKSADEALELLAKREVALAIVDLEGGGLALAQRMRDEERSRRVPILFLTESPGEQWRTFPGEDAGIVDVLAKPVEPRILRHKVETFFDLARQKQLVAKTLHIGEAFAAQIAHDLKNPLNTIVLTGQIIQERTTDPAIRKHTARLLTSSQRMARMVDDLFDLSRSRLGDGIALERKRGDADVLAKEAIANLQASRPEREIHYVAGGDTTGEWDPVRFEQVVVNLVGNALQHGDPNAPVEVSLEGRGPDLVLAVHNGGAIPRTVLPKIFDPFRSGENPRVRPSGLGLGLYIVREIVRAHGGGIELCSTEEEGTTFVLTLPKAS